MIELARFVTGFDLLGREHPRLTSGTPRQVLVGATAAKLAHGRATVSQIAEVTDLPRGTVASSLSRVSGLRDAVDSLGQGPSLPPLDELEPVATYVRSRPQAELDAWARACGCSDGLHALFDAMGEEDWESGRDGQRILELLPERHAFERLWGDFAWLHVEHLDIGHRVAINQAPWWWAA